MLPLTLLSCVAARGRLHPVRPTPDNAEAWRNAGARNWGVSGAVSSAQPVGDIARATPLGPSFVAAVGQRDRMRATLCLASAIYYEAANEGDEGQRAVAQVVLNRVRHNEWPRTICGVVYQGSSRPGCQFSFACDGAMRREPMLSAWIRARRVAERVLAGEVYAPVGRATFYHTTKVYPVWSRRLTTVAIVGAHIFYRLPRDTAEADPLPMRYFGHEPPPGPLPRVAPLSQLLAVAMPITMPVAPMRGAPTINVGPAPEPPSDDTRYLLGALPDSAIREEYRDSGTWLSN